MSNTTYPEWKKFVWNWGRAFAVTFFAQLVVFLPQLEDPSNLQSWLKVVILPALVATITAIMKGIRNKTDDYSSLVYKLPF